MSSSSQFRSVNISSLKGNVMCFENIPLLL